MKHRERESDKTQSLRAEEGGSELSAGPDEQDAELPLGPMREGIVDLHALEEDETVQADRVEAQRRAESGLDD
jgi:hypothetical protein